MTRKVQRELRGIAPPVVVGRPLMVRLFPDVPADLLDANAGTDLDRLIKLAVGYKQVLIDYFGYAAEHCTDRQTANLFEKLRSQEDRAMRRMIRHAQGLADL